MRYLLVIALVACSGTKTTYFGPDASGSAARTCTGAAYDPCTTPSTTSGECLSMNCHLFQQSGFTVCTPSCSTSHPCPPDAAGQPAICNSMGFCKPTVANTCTP